MQTAVLVVLLGVFLCGVHGAEDEPTPDVVALAKSFQNIQTLLTEVKTLQTEVKTLQTKVQTLENQTHGEHTTVAFFASFLTTAATGNHGPFIVATKIVYNVVKTNIGDGYNEHTGIFTAPVKGLYVFHFTMYGTLTNSPTTLAIMRKNTEELAGVLDAGGADPQDSATRVAVVALEKGDTVYVELAATAFFHGLLGLNSFSGFLLSPM